MKTKSWRIPGGFLIGLTMASLLSLRLYAVPASIFVTGHDAVWHSNFGGNAPGAANLARTGIDFARNGSILPFLFVESKTVPVPGGNAHEAPFLTSALGYVAGTDYVVMDAGELSSLANFRIALNSYSAIIVASDHGGMLSADELGFLNAHSSDVIDYLNAGNGLAAFAESNGTGLLGSTPRFQFLPFLVASADFHSAEVANTVTAFGASIGLTDSDVNGNFSHNYFSATGGLTPVDLYNGDPLLPLTLAFRGTVTQTGVPDGGATAGLLLLACGVLVALSRYSRWSQYCACVKASETHALTDP